MALQWFLESTLEFLGSVDYCLKMSFVVNASENPWSFAVYFYFSGCFHSNVILCQLGVLQGFWATPTQRCATALPAPCVTLQHP
jgi:hypothetical protein